METCTQGQQAGSEISARARRNLSKLSILFLIMSSQVLGMGQNPGAKDKSGSESRPSEIPFKLYNDNLIVVKGNVGPIGGVNFILDTGTTPTSISKSLASRLKLSGTSEPLQTLSGAIETQSFVVPHIQIGAFCADQVRVVTQDFKFVEESLGLSIGGILGLDVLGEVPFTIDYTAREVRFGIQPDLSIKVPLHLKQGLAMVDAAIDQQQMHLMLDTGAPSLFLFRNSNASGLRTANVAVSSVGDYDHRAVRLKAVTLGAATFRYPSAFVVPSQHDAGHDFDGLLSPTALGITRLAIDLVRGELEFSKTP